MTNARIPDRISSKVLTMSDTQFNSMDAHPRRHAVVL
jgi:hypothetical protein